MTLLYSFGLIIACYCVSFIVQLSIAMGIGIVVAIFLWDSEKGEATTVKIGKWLGVVCEISFGYLILSWYFGWGI